MAKRYAWELETDEPWAKRLDSAIGRYLDGESASASDLLRAARDGYIRNGRRAMQESEANAAALTGGYANTWAERAGEQAYQDYLSRYAEAFPGLLDYAMEHGTKSAQGVPVQGTANVFAPAGNGRGGLKRDGGNAQRLTAGRSANGVKERLAGESGASKLEGATDGGLLPLTDRVISRTREEERLRRYLSRLG